MTKDKKKSEGVESCDLITEIIQNHQNETSNDFVTL